MRTEESEVNKEDQNNKKMIFEEEGKSLLNNDSIDLRQNVTGPLLILFLKAFYLCQVNSVKLLEDEGGQKHRFGLQLLSASDFFVALTYYNLS